MQVADRTEHITHAVLGGMNNISFGISDDPAFFQILSSALYKNPTLAMVRETICNAWDAHIDSGRADRPLIITLDEEKLVIRDFGKGIPHDLIGPIYGVYGASTKKNDGRQTGGFGLGCKSPFAYTDHFEVVSFHDGKRTIYNMSKSLAEKMGKPSIVPIASFPTDETGIQVTIELANSSDEHHLQSLVRQVVFNGDIKAMFNDELLPVLGLSEAESGFILLNDAAESDMPINSLLSHSAYVRYGNVIYPIETAVEIEPLFSKVTNLLQHMYHCRLILMAPPDSISITPSRESLTMSSITVETLKKLFSNFLDKLMHNREISLKHEKIVEEYIDNASNDSSSTTAGKLSMHSWAVPGIPQVHKNKFLSTVDDFAMLEVLLRYSGKSGTLTVNKWLNVINRYLNNMCVNGEIPRGLLQTWQDAARKGKSFLSDPTQYRYAHTMDGRRSEKTLATTWWRKRVMLPLVDKLSAVVGHNVRDILYYRSDAVYNSDHKGGFTLPINVRRVYINSHTKNLVHFVRPTVYVCHNAEKLPSRIGHHWATHDDTAVGTRKLGTYFVLQIPRKEEVTKQVLEDLQVLADKGEIELMNLTGRTAAEQRDYEERLYVAEKKREEFLLENPGKTEVPRKAKAGLVRLDQLIKDDQFDTLQMIVFEEAERLTAPAFIEKVSTGEEFRSKTDSMEDSLLRAVVKLWGNQGVVTNNKAVFQKQTEEMGIMSLRAFIVDKVVNDIIVSPTLIDHMAFDSVKAQTYLNHQGSYHTAQAVGKFYSVLLNYSEFSSLVPGFTPLSTEDSLKLTVWHEILGDYTWNRDPAIQTAAASVKDLELSQSTKDFLDELIVNPFLGLIDQDNLVTFARSKRKDPQQMAKLKAILSEIIN